MQCSPSWKSDISSFARADARGRLLFLWIDRQNDELPWECPATRSIIDYLEFARTFDRSFPGFDSDVHGLQHQDSPDGRCYTVDCIKE